MTVRLPVHKGGRVDGRLLGHLDDLSPRTPYLPPIVIRPYLALVRAEVDIVPSAEAIRC